MKRIKSYTKEIIRLMKKPQMRILPGQLAFFILLSIIPLLALLGNIAGFVSLPIDVIYQLFSNKISEEIINVLYPLLIDISNTSLIMFYLIAIFMASNGTNSLIITANSIYENENTNFIKDRIRSFVMLFSLISLIIFGLLIPITGDKVITNFGLFINNPSIRETFLNLYHLLKTPLSLLFVFINLKVLYKMSPSVKIKWKTTTKGSIFTTIIWYVMTKIYMLYVTNFSSYNIYYGALSSILVLFIWLYLLAYVFILGMAINSNAYLREQRSKAIAKKTKTN